MLYTGIILSFDHAEDSGLVMLFDGDRKEFSSKDWVDDKNPLEAGIKVFYKEVNNRVMIKLFNEDEDEPFADEEKDEEVNRGSDQLEFSSIREYQAHFYEQGFEMIENSPASLNGEIVMERLLGNTLERVLLSHKGSTPELVQQKVPISSIDECIDYFKALGYNLVKNSEENGSRNASFRRFTVEQEFSEIIITGSDEKINIAKTVNGAKVY